MSDFAAKEFNGGHGLKTSLVAGFERRTCRPKVIFAVPVLCVFSGGQPDVY